MKRLVTLIACFLAGCTTPAPANDNAASNEPKAIPTTTIVVDTNDVSRFRGTTMVDLLKRMDSDDLAEWNFVRRHVYPPAEPPREARADGTIKENFPWPPEDPQKLTDKQRVWRSFALWPAHVRELLLADDWKEPQNRQRLAQFGRMYELTWQFQNAPNRSNERDESDHWRRYAESMLVLGKDGQELLISNMITALTSPVDSMVRNAQSVLVQVGVPAIEPLCAAVWIGHRQRAILDDGSYYVQANPNFNKYVIDTLYRIGPRAVPQVVFELENSLDEKGHATGTSWRFRRYFIELLGRFGHPDFVRTLEAEIDRVKITEYDTEALRRGELVVDAEATDDANFVFREYVIQALGGLATNEALRGIIRLWESDAAHEEAAIHAISQVTRKRVRTPAEAKQLAKSLNVKLAAE